MQACLQACGAVHFVLLSQRWASRASKSAQNQLSKCMSLEFARRRQLISVIMLHPGTVDTDLSQPFQKVCGHPQAFPCACL